LRDGDVIVIDAEAGVLDVHVDSATLRRRTPAIHRSADHGFGRELFGHMRRAVGPAEAGASVLF
jgi:phosphogluconate dehydratase